MSQYDQIPTEDGKLLTKDNEILDLQAFMESGVITATAVDVASPLAPIGEATIPNYEQITPLAMKFIGSDNMLYDFLDFLQSGNLKLQISGGGGVAPSNATYFTRDDETSRLPNSIILQGTGNQIDLTDGVLSLSEELVLSGSLELGGDLNLGTNKITSPSGTTIQLIPDNDTDGIDLGSSFVYVDQEIIHAGETDNKISFTTGAQTNYIGGDSITDINASGFRVGVANARITGISNNPAESSSTMALTAEATQTAIANQLGSAKSFRGGYDASSNLFPATGGSGIGGAIEGGDVWVITGAGTLGGTAVSHGDSIIALTSVPGQTPSNWSINANGVSTWNGRAGVVIPLSGDYNISQITNGLSNALTPNYFFVGNVSTIATATAPQAALNILAGGVTSGQYLRGNGSNILLSAIQAADVPTLNQNTSGQAGSVANALTFNNGGSGDASGGAYNGSAAKTLSYNSVGASPLAGSSSITAVGTITSGTWQGTQIASGFGGTGFTGYTKGDLIHASATNILSKLGIGATNQVLSVVSGDVGWQDLPVTSVFGRAGGAITAQANDYSFNQISGTAGIAQGGTNATSIGGAGTFARSTGTAWGFSSVIYPDTATAGRIMQGAGSAWQEAVLAASTGMNITNISGTITFTNTAPDQTVAISSGTGISATGTYPNFTVTNTAPDLTVGFTNGTGASITGTYPNFTVNVVGGGFTWTDETTTSRTMAINNAYTANNAALCTFTLPTTCAYGSMFRVQGKGAGLFKIAQNSGQSIKWGASSTTVGVGGSLTATAQYDWVLVTCIVADTTFSATGSGAVTIV